MIFLFHSVDINKITYLCLMKKYETKRKEWYNIIFESDTRAGKNFDILLLILIALSILIVLLDSISSLHNQYRILFGTFEWILTILFTIEYVSRIYVHHKPIRYVFSFWGIIDFCSIVPTYFGLFFVGYHYMIVVRIFRLLRVFRIFKLVRFNQESQLLWRSLVASFYKVSIFFLALLMVVVTMGTLMYVVEGESSGFDNIPKSIYWAIVTITTVGYGDMVPQTVIGKFISAMSMIIGYSIIAIPTGIVTAQMSKHRKKIKKQCQNCATLSDVEANFCQKCGKAFVK